jgi:hypothetical protein
MRDSRPEPAADLLYTVRIGSTDHLSEEHPSLGGARTLCQLTIAGTPEGPWSYSTCAECTARAKHVPPDEQLPHEAVQLIEDAERALAHVTADGLAQVVAPELQRLREVLAKIDAGEL